MSKSEFEKARGEASQKFQDAEFKLNPNGFTVAPYVNSTFIMECFDQGADWAYEWLDYKFRRMVPDHVVRKLDKNYQSLSSKQHAQLDHQSKIIAELKGAITEDFFCPDDDCSSCAKVKQALAKVKEMESKTP